jgi:hypothetical protein
MHRFTIIVSVLVFLVAILGAAAFIVPKLPPSFVAPAESREVEAIGKVVQDSIEKTGAPPSEADVAAITRSRRVFYRIQSDGGVLLGFSKGFDDQFYFDSRSKQWSETEP